MANYMPKNRSPTSVSEIGVEMDDQFPKRNLFPRSQDHDDDRSEHGDKQQATKPSARSTSIEQDFLRRFAAFELLYHFWACPGRWFYAQESGRPRVGFWPEGYLPMPEPPLAAWLEQAIEVSFLLSVVFLFLATRSLTSGVWVRYAGFLMALSYIGLELFDATRASGVEIHSVALLFIASSADDGLIANRIATAGTWFWAGFHKINPGFLESYTLADPFVDMVLGPEFAAKHRINLHLMAAVSEAIAGLVLLVCSWDPKPTSGGNWMVRAAVIFCGVFMASMHLMIVKELYELQWDIIVIGKNVQCAFLAIWLWSSWWKSQPVSESSRRILCRSGKIAVIGAAIVFVIVPAGLTFGITDPYLGISLYSYNNPSFVVEFPTELSDKYEQWGFLNWPRPIGWNIPTVPASTYDGRSVYRRDYILMNVAGTGGHEGYPAIWYYKRYATKVCEEIRAASKERDTPKAIDDARFFIQHHYTGRKLFEALKAMLLTGEEVDEPTLLVREGCRQESENDWRPLGRKLNYHAVSFAVEPGSTPVNIYRIGRTDGEVRPELTYEGSVSDDEPLVVGAWAGAQFLAAVGGGHRRSFEAYSSANNLCAIDVFLVSESVNHRQFFKIDPGQGNTSGRTVSGLRLCSVKQVQHMYDDDKHEDVEGDEYEEEKRQFFFINAPTFDSSIDLLWVPPDDEDNPIKFLSEIAPGESGYADSYVGHRFRAVPTGEHKSCHGESDYVVNDEQTSSIRHVFCAEPNEHPAGEERDEF